MGVYRMLCIRALLLLLAVPSCLLASTGGILPQRSHGITVNTVRSDAAGASLSAVTGGPVELGEAGRPFTSGVLWALPLGAATVDVSVRDTEWRDLLPGEFADSIVTSVAADPQPLVSASQVMTMRALKFTSIAVNALQPRTDGNGLRVCTHVEFDLRYTGRPTGDEHRRISRSFYDLAHGVAANLDEVVPAPELRPEAYLVITHPGLVGTALTTFVNWKKARGHTVYVATTDVTGTGNQSIKTYIQNAYDQLAEPPVYVVLMGDVDDSYPVASWQEPGFFHPFDVSDHPYTLLDGTDWLPDVFIGRLSVDGANEFQTVVNKCVLYESQPFQPTGAWRNRMLITGVRASEWFYPTYNSSWQTLQWIRRQFLESGYSAVDSVPAPPGSTSQISASINSGVSFAGYRGFGAPDMWDFPSFTVNDVLNLNNGQKLPVITSIVCGGGAFDNASVDPCFGKAWLRAGTPTNLKGGIGFIGPSELDTKTRWNNTNIAAIYQGILHENVQTLGAAMLRGKLELIREFPNNINNNNADSDRSVRFYFYVYNLLGDPGLNFFVGNVRDLSAVVPEVVTQGVPALSIPVTEDGAPLPDVWGTVKVADTIFCRAASDSSGLINLALPQTSQGDVIVTLTKPRHEPVVDTVHVVLAASSVAASSLTFVDNGAHGSIGNGDGIPGAGERIALGVVLHNYGTGSFAGGTVAVLSGTPAITVVNGQAAVPSLPAGAQTDTLFLVVTVAPGAGDGQVGQLNWSVSPGNNVWLTTVDIHAPRLTVVSVHTDGLDANPLPETTSWVTLGVSNTGRAAVPAGNITIHSQDARLTLIDSVSAYPALAPGSSAMPSDLGFHLGVGGFFPGDWTGTYLVADGGGLASSFDFSLPLGNIAGGDPTHPDAYGYRAFQNTDSGFSESPVFAWLEIDPTRGGAGTVLNVPDTGTGHDTSVVIALPFNFTFYGVSYSHIGVGSNGFISFGQSVESYFRNYSLPAVASPDQMIAAFWDDLAVPTTGHICTWYDTESSRFIVEWSHCVNTFDDVTEETFQIALYDAGCWPTRTGDGDILVQYLAFNNIDDWDNYATLGIQDRDRNGALQLGYANQWSPGVSTIRAAQSVLYTTGRPQSSAYLAYAGNLVGDDNVGGAHGNGDGVPNNGETVRLSIRLSNTGAAATTPQSGVLHSLDPYVVRLDSALTFPAVAPGDTGVSSTVHVQILSNTPNNHVCNFSVRFGNGSAPCVVLPSLQVVGPVLAGLLPIMDDDSIPPSQGNGNHEFNPGETVELTPGANNAGDAGALGISAVLRYSGNRISILDSLAYLGTIASDSQRYAADPFVIHVASFTSDGEIFPVTIVLRDSFGMEWSYTQSYMIGAPDLAAAGARVADPAPGGNGDGHLNLGESGEIYPRVVNTGMGSATNVSISLSSRDPLVTLADTMVFIGIVSGSSTRESDVPLHVTVSPTGTEPRTVIFDVTIRAAGGFQNTDQLVVLIGDALLFDDFEVSTDNWSTYGSNNLWHSQTQIYHSAAHAFYCGDDGSQQYPPMCDGYLRSPAFSFDGTGTLILSTRYQLADANDLGRIHLQIGPTSYALLGTITGSSSGWEERHYSLTGLQASEEARVRFWFTSNASGQGGGWYVDDIIVLGSELRAGDPQAGPLPDRYELLPSFPNPFNDQTTIRYAVPRSTHVSLTLFDLQGRKVATLVDGPREPGVYSLSYRPIQLASGIYFVRLDAAGIRFTGKIAYLK